MYSKNEYFSSALAKKILKTPRLAFLDIDNTLTGKESEVNKVRESLEKLEFGIILVTARTEEMLMSSKQYRISKKLGFKRPPAKLEKKEPSGILDPDIIIGSSGTAILIKQSSGGYLPDAKYQNKLKKNRNWRKNTLNLFKKIDPTNKYYSLPVIENPKNYYKGLANILTPKYRIQVNFKNFKDKEHIYHALQKVENRFNLNLSDDSDLRKDKYSFFLTPKGISKSRAVNQVIENICQIFPVKRSILEILFAGDALADLDMGYLEKEVKNTTLLIVGGSRLNNKQIKSFTSKISGFPPKSLIIGDKVYPGTIGPQTILAYLPSTHPNSTYSRP